MISSIHVIASLGHIWGMTRTLRQLEPLLGRDGKPLYFVGNASVCAVVMLDGVKSLMKCYTLHSSHLQQIYGERYYPRELLVYTGEQSSEWVDVVVDKWRDGETLTVELISAVAANDQGRIKRLSDIFNTLALELISAEWAHGDLTPDNIIVAATERANEAAKGLRTAERANEGAEADIEMHLIDFDAKFCPSMAGCASVELGTAAFQHPSRSAELFDRHIDDYSIALIASALRALSYDISLFEKYRDEDGLLLDAETILSGRSGAYEEIKALFLERGDALFYRIVQSLALGTYHIPRLAAYVKMAAQLSQGNRANTTSATCVTSLLASSSGSSDSSGYELFEDCGVWGYLTSDGQVAIAAIYDEAYDFREGVAVVRIDKYWQYIGTDGRVIRNCGAVETLRPAKGGLGTMLKGGEWHTINLMDATE